MPGLVSCSSGTSVVPEAKYFDALVRLFDLKLATGQLAGACEALEKLVEIDPYDSRNQQRMDQIQGRAEPALLSRLKSKLTSAAPHAAQTPAPDRSRGKDKESSPALRDEVHPDQSLDDLLVQAEIFVQYSLQSKAIERLERIVELFPGEQARNERLQSLESREEGSEQCLRIG